MTDEGRSRTCKRCGDPVSAYHFRIWPDSPNQHVTCATLPLVNGACPFAGNAEMCGKHATGDARSGS